MVNSTKHEDKTSKPTTVRFPPLLRNAILSEAKTEDRSESKMIATLCREALKARREKEVTPNVLS